MGVIQPSMTEIVDYYAACNKSRSSWELETVYEMAASFVAYVLSGKDEPAPRSKITMSDDDYLKEVNKLFGK